MTTNVARTTAEVAVLSDLEIDLVSGGSPITQMAAAGVQGAAKGGSRFSFPIGPKTGKDGGGKCSSNHNGVRY